MFCRIHFGLSLVVCACASSSLLTVYRFLFSENYSSPSQVDSAEHRSAFRLLDSESFASVRFGRHNIGRSSPAPSFAHRFTPTHTHIRPATNTHYLISRTFWTFGVNPATSFRCFPKCSALLTCIQSDWAAYESLVGSV